MAGRGNAVEVELLGLARLLARRQTVLVPLEAEAPLVRFAQGLAAEVPELVGTVLTEEGGLLGGHAFSRAGTDLIQEPGAMIRPGERLLLLSTLAGGWGPR
jgi:hypothetical protein